MQLRANYLIKPLLMLYFQKMSTQSGDYFDGATSIVDAHDDLQVAAGNATWLNQYTPVIEGPKKRIGEVLLCLFYNLGLCFTIVGDFARYIGGKVTSHPIY